MVLIVTLVVFINLAEGLMCHFKFCQILYTWFAAEPPNLKTRNISGNTVCSSYPFTVKLITQNYFCGVSIS